MNAAQFEKSLADLLMKQWVKLDKAAGAVWELGNGETDPWYIISDVQDAISSVAKALKGVENE